MFTGIVEETGQVISVKKGSRSSRLTIRGDLIFEDIKVGDSIAVNGVCLTVSRFQETSFEADVMRETLERSTLGNLEAKSKVNLERAMPADGRFGGHIVSGHIDGTGRISEMRKDDNAIWVTVEADDNILGYIIEKGSVCIDGISLTIASVGQGWFCVSVIPHTADATILGEKQAGDIVNLENDMIGKYIKQFVSKEQEQVKSDITMEFLQKAGF